MEAAPVACPFCKNTEWRGFPKGIILRQDDPRVLGGGFSALGFICTRCGFLRLQVPPEADETSPGRS